MKTIESDDSQLLCAKKILLENRTEAVKCYGMRSKDAKKCYVTAISVKIGMNSDIAMSFATWISPDFQLYIMKDCRRLKTDEDS